MKKIDGSKGETRSAVAREYMLHTPDAFVRTPMPEVTNGAAIVHASPALGAGFLQYTAELEAGGQLAEIAEQRFVWVLEGEASVEIDAVTHSLQPGCYAYLPSGFKGAIAATSTCRLAVVEKTYQPVAGAAEPAAFAGDERHVGAVPLAGDTKLLVRSLLPSDNSFDFAVNTMTYAPGAALAQVEVHVMEHGLVMLEGRGRYLLGDARYDVAAGDFIWMAPYCPQWFVAEGDAPAKYLIYKDWNRRPRL